jgi:hypothetical protein
MQQDSPLWLCEQHNVRKAGSSCRRLYHPTDMVRRLTRHRQDSFEGDGFPVGFVVGFLLLMTDQRLANVFAELFRKYSLDDALVAVWGTESIPGSLSVR